MLSTNGGNEFSETLWPAVCSGTNMKLVIVNENEAGQRLDKLLAKYLSEASKSFLYKMLRKKNITLNEKKANGNEKTALHDEIRFFLSDETFDKFSKKVEDIPTIKKSSSLQIIYEDKHILLLNKPANMLSQKAKSSDISINEEMLAYLLESKQITKEELKTFRPAVCNRLDRNTSGLIVAGKTLAGLQTMAEVFKDRSLHKYYLCLVFGEVAEERTIDGWLIKDEKQNKVQISQEHTEGALPIHTMYTPLEIKNGVTLLKVWLITGRSHQIRAHLASIGHPIIGDTKYGNRKVNQKYETSYGVKYQMLHSYQLVMPQIKGDLEYLSGKEFTAKVPAIFEKVFGKKF